MEFAQLVDEYVSDINIDPLSLQNKWISGFDQGQYIGHKEMQIHRFSAKLIAFQL